jgi:putative radical SAM enzyme (TIGR03279 family)
MEKGPGLIVKRVFPRSIGSKLGVKPGDRILSINGCNLRDEIDYRFLLTDRAVRIRIFGESQGEREVRLRKNWDDGMGLEFAPPRIRSCNNRCLFCFVDQLPPGLRPSLYIKDEDYRLSFLHGSYLTLTNLLPKDWGRITKQRLSPLFISVHSTEPSLRRFLLGNANAPDIMPQLRSLAKARIEMHLQVVLCPGLNDGPSLEKTIRDLATLYPQARSLSIVPVGLTAYRQGLFSLRPMSPTEAEEIVELSGRMRREFRREQDTYFLHLADEIYLLAERPFPAPRTYEGYPQLENGVGLARRFLTEFRRGERSLPPALEKGRDLLLLTGESALGIIRPVVNRLNEINNLRIEATSIPNSLFGPTVTVAGLLGGRDFGDFLKRMGGKADVLLPESALRDQEETFLDDVTIPQLRQETGRNIFPIRESASALLRFFLQSQTAKRVP